MVKKRDPGQPLTVFPNRDWNRIADTVQTVKQWGGSGNGTGQSRGDSSILEIAILNNTGADLTAEYPILKTSTAAYTLANMRRRRIALNGINPVEGETFVIVQGPLKDGKIGTAAIHGYSLCEIDVSDADHEFATVEDDNVANLVSVASGGVRIVDKESGTGVVWAIVDLGGGGEGGATNAGWGKVVAHSGSTGITAADPTTTPPTVGWGYINPCSCPSLPEDINEEPEHDPLPGELQYATDEETFLVVYNMVPSEILPGVEVDIFVQYKTLAPSGHRFVDVQSCVEV